jgi:hypothetical protein
MQQSSDAGYGGLVHFAFDLLELDGENVARLPLLRRKERLAQLLQDPPAGIVYSEHNELRSQAMGEAQSSRALSARVKPGVDAPPVFEPSEHVFDFVALLVEEGVIGDGDLRLDFDGMQTVMPRFARAARNQSAS